MESGVKRVFEGLSLVAVGLVFLGNTTGALPWSVWLNILSLWPLLLVSAGIDLIGKSLDSGWVRVLSSLVFIGGLAYAVFLMPADGWPGTLGVRWIGGESVAFSDEVEGPAGLEDAELEVGQWAGRLEIRAGSGDLIAWEGRSRGGEPEVDVSEEASSAAVRVDAPDRGGAFLGRFGDERLELELDDSVPWTVRLRSGAGDLDVDLSGVTMRGFDIDSGFGSATIRLGDPDGARTPMTVESGVASVSLAIPEDAEGRIRFESGIGSHSAPEGYERNGDWWESPGFGGGEDSWEIVFRSGIGSVSVSTY